jgi:hypothetical protein
VPRHEDAPPDTLLAGATGLIGRARAAQWRGPGRLHLLVRRPVPAPGPHCRAHVVDYAALPALPPAGDAVCCLGTRIAVVARPSLLSGDRAVLGQPVRRAEALALAATRPLAPLVPKAWRPIEAATVARALQAALQQGRPGRRIVSSGEMQDLGRASAASP